MSDQTMQQAVSGTFNRRAEREAVFTSHFIHTYETSSIAGVLVS